MEEKIYSLYNNKEQETLHALAYSKEELKQISLGYTEGVWFEYDVEETNEGSSFLWNERPYKGRVKFGSEEEVDALKKEKEEIRKTSQRMGLNSNINLR